MKHTHADCRMKKRTRWRAIPMAVRRGRQGNWTCLLTSAKNNLRSYSLLMHGRKMSRNKVIRYDTRQKISNLVLFLFFHWIIENSNRQPVTLMSVLKTIVLRKNWAWKNDLEVYLRLNLKFYEEVCLTIINKFMREWWRIEKLIVSHPKFYACLACIISW